jgi:hypothetical protein
MLTNHNYDPINTEWDQDVLECCKNENPDDPTCTDCCYDSWQNELKIVTQSYSQANEKADQLQSKWNLFSDRKITYKTWVDELEKAENYARDICFQLELIAIQSDKIWFNSCKAADAIEILFCMIRDYFMQIDLLKTIYDDLQNCITKNNNSSLVKGQGILKYLDDYKQKLDVVLKGRDDIMISILEAIRLSKLITNQVSTRDCHDKNNNYVPCAEGQKPCTNSNGNEYYGLKTIICEWYNDFACDVPCKNEIDQDNQQQYQQQNQQQYQQQSQQGQYSQNSNNQQNNEDECESENCELLPTFDFPICNNSYKKCIEKWLADDESKLTELTTELQEAKKNKEALIACKTSLDNAIKAVNPKDRCK